MNDKLLEELCQKIVDSFAEEDRWTFEKSSSLESFKDRSGIIFFKSLLATEENEPTSFSLVHGEKRRVIIPHALGEKMWAEAMKMKPHEKRSDEAIQWFIDRFDNKN